MAATSRAFFLSRVADLSLKQPLQPPPPYSRHLLIRPLLPAVSAAIKRRSPAVVSCLISGVDGGGVSDDFVSTRKSDFGRGFSVIANMLKRIEPLDTSIISKGVSDSAKDSMKQTISTMLGLLPSDQFSVTVRVSRSPLDRLLVSSIITGYTLWNAEYRISLMRNYDISTDGPTRNFLHENEVLEVKREESEGGGGDAGVDGCVENVERMNRQSLGDLSPEALNYIRQLELELSTVKQVIELSRPSSLEVEEIIHQLVQNTLQRFFKAETPADFMEDSAIGNTENKQNGDDEFCDSISTSRDYLAKLLFWCMSLGHHLRGLENRLHLSCVVGLL